MTPRKLNQMGIAQVSSTCEEEVQGHSLLLAQVPYGRILTGQILNQGKSSELFPIFAVGPDTIKQRTDSRSLFFFCASRGKIISSRKGEQYTTFQELRSTRVTAPGQISDMWLVRKLHQHYHIINRRQQTLLWDIISMKTIGFATFIRVCIT
jgi:hypothetical protein